VDILTVTAPAQAGAITAAVPVALLVGYGIARATSGISLYVSAV
jgi:hypothetical protein